MRLRSLGFEVHVIERQDDLGGRAQVFEVDGYRHDAGPTVITAPFLFDELFELFGERRQDHIEFRELSRGTVLCFQTVTTLITAAP